MGTGRHVVLCVDDERIVLSALREELRRHLGPDLAVETAESGDEGLEVMDDILRDGDVLAVVVSDQLMPGMRGEALLAAVHARDPRVLNIMLTGQADADAVGEAVNRARLYRYLPKPWDGHDLGLTVRAALDSYAQARALEQQEEQARLSHVASLRFVPRDVLSLLGRERLVDVEFGDHVERDMHILFADMRAYTRLVEGKTAAQAFTFVNTFIQRIDHVVRAHGGFVANIEGDAVLALFGGSAEAAVSAGVDIQRAIDGWNAERREAGEERVHAGVGVNSGPLLLGTVGGSERLQCDVVGGAVNIASRVESLTKLYGARMLISDATADCLSSPPSLREVDRVIAKGSALPIRLFEVLDALPVELAESRRATQHLLQEGMRAFRAGTLIAAQQAFQALAEADPTDVVAAVYLARCEELQHRGLPDDWMGVTRMTIK